MNYPKLSVLIPVYNGERFLRRCLDSILTQTVSPREIVIVDDASIDNTMELILEYQKRCSLIRVLRNERNMGLVWTQNRLIEESMGEYLFFIACDDWIEKDFFLLSLDMLKTYPNAGLCCTDPSFYHAKEEKLVKGRFCWSDEPAFFDPLQVRKVLRTGFYIETHTIITKKESVIKAGGYLKQLSWHADWFLAHVIALREGICYIPKPLAIREMRDDAWSAECGDFSKRADILTNIIRLLKTDYIDCLPAFVDSTIMHTFGTHPAEVLLKNPEFWDIQSLLLCAVPLFKTLFDIDNIQRQRFKIAHYKNKVDELYDLFCKKGHAEMVRAIHKMIKELNLDADFFSMLITMLLKKRMYFTARHLIALAPNHIKDNQTKTLLRPLDEMCHTIQTRCLVAEELIKGSKYEMAIEQLRLNIENCIDHADSINNLAIAYFKIGKPQEARQYINQALDLSPEDEFIKENYRTITESLY